MAYVDTEPRGQLRMQHGGQTLLYDAVDQASDEVIEKAERHPKLSDRVFGWRRHQRLQPLLEDAVEAARRAEHAHLFGAVLRLQRLSQFQRR